MSCDVCLEPYSIPGREALVLQCGHGHSICSSCLEREVSARGSPVRCPTCRQPDARPVSDLPHNNGLADAAGLEVAAQLGSLWLDA
jgi:hypothetical protein